MEWFSPHFYLRREDEMIFLKSIDNVPGWVNPSPTRYRKTEGI